MVFIDTSAFLGIYNVRDQYHKEASIAWGRLAKEKVICMTSNLVLNETLTLLARRAGYSFAAERARAIYIANTITILRPTHDDEIEAITFLEKYADQQVGFTDCVSFVLMRKKRIQSVFTFDRHFTFAGFQLWR